MAINSIPIQLFLYFLNKAIIEDDNTMAYNKKVTKLQILQGRWTYKDTKKEVLVKEALQVCQKSRYKELKLIIFGFILYKAQMKAIHTLFFEQKDLLLFAKTNFKKSLIFQLLPFFTAVFEMVLTLMSLKLLQVEQSELINRLSEGGRVLYLMVKTIPIVYLMRYAKGGIYIYLPVQRQLSPKYLRNIFLIILLLLIRLVCLPLMRFTQEKSRIRTFVQYMLKLRRFDKQSFTIFFFQVYQQC